jgi:D-sedoheptulose 7-phosphate isomerase
MGLAYKKDIITDFSPDINRYLYDIKLTLDKMNIQQINTVMHKLIEVYQRGGFIYIFGNGGSAATASHFVNDFNKGVSGNLQKKFRFCCLNDNVPSMMAIANDNSFDQIFKSQLENYLTQNDLVIGISGSGNSNNVVQAIEYANDIGVETIGLVGYNGGKIKEIVKYYIHVPVDNMQRVEDLHMMMDHLIMKILKEYLERCANDY